MILNIAIDGPAGAGKSTIAKILAKKMNLVYLDTGAMYRGSAYYAIKRGVDVADEKAVLKILPDLKMEIAYEDGAQKVIVCGEDVTPYIREHNISMAASTISKIPAMRLKLVELQREIAASTPCILDGRDIGSYVLPNAKYKIFLTADAKVRAMRRVKELNEKGVDISFEEVLKDIEARDYQDTHREFAPLVVAEGAILVDTSDLTIEQVADKISEICK